MRKAFKKTATIASVVFLLLGCTKQQAVNTVDSGVQIAVDLCQEAPQFLPPNTPAGTIVSLLCPIVGETAPTVEVLIDHVIWNSMVKAYEAQHPGFVVRQYTGPKPSPNK